MHVLHGSELLVVAMILTGCGLEDQGASLGETFDDGKADVFGDDDDSSVVVCNGGALVIETSSVREGELVAIVFDAGVVDWFVEQSETTYTTEVEYSGSTSTVTVQRAFPWMVSVEDSATGHVLVIEDLRAYSDGSFTTSGPGGVTIRPDGGGLRLTISGSEMVSSHSVVYYDVGDWRFEHCTDARSEVGGEDGDF